MDAYYLFNEPGGFGLRRVKIPRHQNGFGFTLRHFIVYPPELYVNNDQEEGNVQQRRNRKRMVKVTEPVDTIFVKSIVENGPADRAGLCVGDRIVSVNGQTIFGKSYDQVVQLIQKTQETLRLDVSPKQYDTLQLFFEETAYRPETNQRPSNHTSASTKVSPQDYYGYSQRHYNPPSVRRSHDRNHQFASNSSSESFFLNHNHNQNSMSSKYPDTAHSNPQLFSHLPRPTPYKSSSVWSNSSTSQPQQRASQPQLPVNRQQTKNQPQTYYPFNQDLQLSESFGASPLWKIKEEPTSGTKSAESILAGNESGRGDYGEYYGSAQRSESLECLTGVNNSGQKFSSGSNWNNAGPGYRYSVATDGNMDPSSQRRESTGSMPSSGVQNAMVVTMSSTNSKLQSPYPHDYGDPSTAYAASNPYNSSNVYAASEQGYENKIADRIRRSCEQKEEFLRRPNQPLGWAPQKSSSTAFPKELYAQPQKFEKIPWPPAHIVPTVTSTKPPVQNSSTSSSSSYDGQVKNLNNVSVVSVQHYPDNGQSPYRVLSPVVANVSNYESDRSANLRSQVLSSSQASQYESRSISPSWLEYGPRNRTTIVGSRKLHCDPPPDWNPDLSSLTYRPTNEEESESGDTLTTSLRSETETDCQAPGGPVPMLYSASGAPLSITLTTESGRRVSANGLSLAQQRPNYLALPRDMSKSILYNKNADNFAAVSHQLRLWPNQGFIDAEEVKLRKRELDLDQDNDRLVRRVSYLKATSSPIDMDRKSSSPTSPTRSCELLGKPLAPVADVGRRRSVANKLSAEFFPKGRIIRLKQFFEDRTQPPSIFKFSIDSPTSEYRGFGSFHTDKSPDTSEVTREGQVHFKIRVGENKRGGYNRSWRQGWAQIRRSGCLYISKERLSRDSVMITEDSVILALSLRSGVSIEHAEDYSKRKHVVRIKTSYTSEDLTNLPPESGFNANAPQPTNSTAVEILLQADDANDCMLWLHCLHTQLENNNYCNGNSSSFKGIFFGSEFSLKQKSILTSFLPSATPAHSQSQPLEKTVTNVNNNSLHPGVNAANNAASPKTKTWKGKVARQWKKVHNIIDTGGETKGTSPYTSIAPVGATFGQHLENCPPGERNPLVPRIIEYSIEVVEGRGIDMVGLYRIPGNNASVATLTERLNKSEDPNPDKDPRWLDVHVVASLIKSFLRRLPDPLLTDDRYQAFIVAADDPDPEKCREKMQYLISDLPNSNYETLRAVIMHLKKVSEHGESNRMDARNLAIVFGPTIVRTAEENVTSMVADMKNQCKIVEMLVSHAEELFKERRIKTNETSPRLSEVSNSISRHISSPSTSSVQTYSRENSEPSNVITGPSISPVPTIESEIRASVLQAAMRKASQKSKSTPAQNVYGLPNKPSKRTKPIDDAGFIRSYAGLNEETEQRVRKFELETRAMLSREDRSPHASVVNVGVVSGKPTKGMDDIRIHRLKLDDELQKAKDDLENEDIYDQLADNPSSIVHHRDRGLPMFPVTPGARNLSSSSISSSNSNSTVPSSHPLSAVGIQKLGPAPYKSAFVPQSLPPKPPQLHSSGSSLIGPMSIQSKSSLSSSSSPVSPIRRVSSMDRLGTGDFDSHVSSSINAKLLDRSKAIDRKLGPLPFVPKHFGGSLDSLKDIANGNNNDAKILPSGEGVLQTQHIGPIGIGGGHVGSREDFSPRSSEGSDLVTSLSRTLDKKLHSLRRSHENEGTAYSSLSSNNNLDSQDENEEGEGEPEVFQVLTENFSIPEETDLSMNPDQSKDSLPKLSDESSKVEGEENCKAAVVPRVSTNGAASKRNWRRNSMIERRVRHVDVVNGGSTNTSNSEEDRSYYRNPSLHRLSGDAWSGITNGSYQPALTKEAKTATNRLTRDCRRRHSLSGAGDILSFALGGDKERQCVLEVDKTEIDAMKRQQNSKTLSNDAIATALTSAGILESHV